MSDEALAATYDAAPYQALAHAFTHPGRVAALARLLGLDPGPVETCRVLEIGCAMGSNLIPMAVSLPKAQFIGIDLSARQIEQARRTAADLSLANIDFRHLNLRDVDETLGRFDYIIAHGVFSWVPTEVQEKLLRVCSTNLSPRGVAMVSFNTFPGWHYRGLLREMMVLHAPESGDPASRAAEARRLLDGLAQVFAGQPTHYAASLRDELDRRHRWTDTDVIHDLLGLEQHPVYFREFVAQASAHGLQYLWDTHPAATAIDNFPPTVRQWLLSTARSMVELEQLVDVLRYRSFRRALLCHANVPIDRTLRPQRLAGLNIATLPPVHRIPDPASATFTFGESQITIGDPRAAALLDHLIAAHPCSVSFESLAALGSLDAIAKLLVTLLLHGAIEFTAHGDPFTTQLSDRPTASPYARLQSTAAPRVTNLRHETVELTEPQRQLLPAVDGTLSASELAQRTGLTVAAVTATLMQLAAAALLLK